MNYHHSPHKATPGSQLLQKSTRCTHTLLTNIQTRKHGTHTKHSYTLSNHTHNHESKRDTLQTCTTEAQLQIAQPNQKHKATNTAINIVTDSKHTPHKLRHFPKKGTSCRPRNTQWNEHQNTYETHHTHISSVHSLPRHKSTDTRHLKYHIGKTFHPTKYRTHTQYQRTHNKSTEHNPTKGTTTPHRPCPPKHHTHDHEAHP